MKKLVGRTDIEDALGRLDRLTQDEVRMAAAEGLKATHKVDNKVQGVGDKVDLIVDGVQLFSTSPLHGTQFYLARW